MFFATDSGTSWKKSLEPSRKRFARVYYQKSYSKSRPTALARSPFEYLPIYDLFTRGKEQGLATPQIRNLRRLVASSSCRVDPAVGRLRTCQDGMDPKDLEAAFPSLTPTQPPPPPRRSLSLTSTSTTTTTFPTSLLAGIEQKGIRRTTICTGSCSSSSSSREEIIAYVDSCYLPALTAGLFDSKLSLRIHLRPLLPFLGQLPIILRIVYLFLCQPSPSSTNWISTTDAGHNHRKNSKEGGAGVHAGWSRSLLNGGEPKSRYATLRPGNDQHPVVFAHIMVAFSRTNHHHHYAFPQQTQITSASAHSRSNSQSASAGGGAQIPWRPSATPNPQGSNNSNVNGTQQHHVRNRARSGTESSSSTSSSQGHQHHSSATAPPLRPHSRLANVTTPADNGSARPPSRHQHRKLSTSGNSGGGMPDNTKARMYQDTMAKYQALVRDADEKLQVKLAALQQQHGERPSSRAARRNSSSFFLSSFGGGSEKKEREKERDRLIAEHKRNVDELTHRMEEERKGIHREERRRRRASSNAPIPPPIPPQRVKSAMGMGRSRSRGVLIEDDVPLPSQFPMTDDLSPTAEEEDWVWRPSAGEFEGSSPEAERRREEVRRDQQAILDSIKRSGGNNSSPTDANGRKVKWAQKQSSAPQPVIPPRPLSTIPSTGSSVPTLPPTPHTAHLLLQQQQQQRSGSPYARMSPAIPMGPRPPSAQAGSGGISNRSASARPASPAHMHARWLPTVNDYAADIRRGAASSAAKPVQIPGRGHKHQGSIGNADTITENSGSVGSGSLSGSWRDWSAAGSANGGSVKSQTLAHAQALEGQVGTLGSSVNSSGNGNGNNSWGRRSMTPAPGSSASRYANSNRDGGASGPPVPDIPRKRTLSFSSASAAAAASASPTSVTNAGNAVPPHRVKERDFASLPSSKGKKSLVVDDRDHDVEHAAEPAPSPALPSEDLVLAPSIDAGADLARRDTATSSSAAPSSTTRKDKGKGKAKAPPPPPPQPTRSPFVELASGMGGVKSLYAQQIEDLAGQLRRELGVGA
ncbi:hypothetical protein SCHPADRAFT_932418 [Schizopora paradoxa]|uniref:Uncharacterized protein n=1 Tax=Schizopora paradoxa TaxID=27342 RepID=A0A0H2R6P3_9AGAM|nr:hypothetical protein SCHPADRAFT_932418 [Schizopora paradoxa]